MVHPIQMLRSDIEGLARLRDDNNGFLPAVKDFTAQAFVAESAVKGLAAATILTGCRALRLMTLLPADARASGIPIEVEPQGSHFASSKIPDLVSTA